MPKPPHTPPPNEEQSAQQASDASEAAQGQEQGGRAARNQKGFSETQWFMKGMEVDADLLEMVEEDEYDRDENISEADRKGFTLRRDDDK